MIYFVSDAMQDRAPHHSILDGAKLVTQWSTVDGLHRDKMTVPPNERHVALLRAHCFSNVGRAAGELFDDH